jgi:hypothetical protein
LQSHATALRAKLLAEHFGELAVLCPDDYLGCGGGCACYALVFQDVSSGTVSAISRGEEGSGEVLRKNRERRGVGDIEARGEGVVGRDLEEGNDEGTLLKNKKGRTSLHA